MIFWFLSVWYFINIRNIKVHYVLNDHCINNKGIQKFSLEIPNTIFSQQSKKRIRRTVLEFVLLLSNAAGFLQPSVCWLNFTESICVSLTFSRLYSVTLSDDYWHFIPLFALLRFQCPFLFNFSTLFFHFLYARNANKDKNWRVVNFWRPSGSL